MLRMVKTADCPTRVVDTACCWKFGYDCGERLLVDGAPATAIGVGKPGKNADPEERMEDRLYAVPDGNPAIAVCCGGAVKTKRLPDTLFGNGDENAKMKWLGRVSAPVGKPGEYAEIVWCGKTVTVVVEPSACRTLGFECGTFADVPGFGRGKILGVGIRAENGNAEAVGYAEFGKGRNGVRAIAKNADGTYAIAK